MGGKDIYDHPIVKVCMKEIKFEISKLRQEIELYVNEQFKRKRKAETELPLENGIIEFKENMEQAKIELKKLTPPKIMDQALFESSAKPVIPVRMDKSIEKKTTLLDELKERLKGKKVD